YDPNWVLLGTGFTGAPASSGEAGVAVWSDRHTMTVTIVNSGVYHVAFGASDTTGPLGSVAIANVQLESVANGTGATAYSATSSTRETISNVCTNRSSEDLRTAFERKCDDTGTCF